MRENKKTRHKKIFQHTSWAAGRLLMVMCATYSSLMTFVNMYRSAAENVYRWDMTNQINDIVTSTFAWVQKGESERANGWIQSSLVCQVCDLNTDCRKACRMGHFCGDFALVRSRTVNQKQQHALPVENQYKTYAAIQNKQY